MTTQSKPIVHSPKLAKAFSKQPHCLQMIFPRKEGMFYACIKRSRDIRVKINGAQGCKDMGKSLKIYLSICMQLSARDYVDLSI